MGRVRLNSEYIAFDPDTVFMEGAHIPNENEQDEDQIMTEQHNLSDEESKDDPMSSNFDITSGGKTSNDDKYSSLPNIDTLLTQHGLNYNPKSG